MALSDYSDSENSGDESSETMDRRKFTLPPEMNDHLESLAEDHYSGSVSQYIRAAIKDHERTLDGQDEFAYKELKSEVEGVKKSVGELKEFLKEESSQVVENRALAGQTSSENAEIKAVEHEAVRKVQSCIVEAESQGLTLEEVIERSGLDPLKTQRALQQLLDQELIDRTSEQETDYFQIKVA